MQAYRLPARQGLVWIIAGYRLLRANPPLLGLMTFAYLISVSLALALPLNIGRVIFLLVQPMLLLIVANGCRVIAQHGKRIAQFNPLTGVRERRGQLLQLGALQMAALLVTTALVVLMFSLFGETQPDPENPASLMPLVLVSAVTSLPIMAATWFAPVLIGWHGITPLKAAFFSLVAMLRNWRAFLVYGLLIGGAFGLALLGVTMAQQIEGTAGQFAALVIEFLLLLGSPIVICGPYVSYRDIFVALPTAHE